MIKIIAGIVLIYFVIDILLEQKTIEVQNELEKNEVPCFKMEKKR